LNNYRSVLEVKQAELVQAVPHTSCKRGRMLKIQRSSNGQVTYMLSGQIEEEDIAELEALIRSEAKGHRIVLDLKNLTLAGQDAIAFLDRCEANGITLKNCPAYIREWIKGQRSKSWRLSRH